MPVRAIEAHSTGKYGEGKTVLCVQDLSLPPNSISITVDTYYHWMPGSGKSEVDQLDLNSAPVSTLYAPGTEKIVNGVDVTI